MKYPPRYVYYHFPCNDGFTSAFLWHMIDQHEPDIFVPINHGDKIDVDKHSPEDVLVFLDFTPPKETLEALIDKVAHIAIHDHHISAKETLDSVTNCFVNFHNGICGSKILYEYFESYHFDVTKYGMLVDYINDHDVWEKSLPKHREVQAYIQSMDYTFEAWEQLAYNLDRDFSIVVNGGKEILRFQERLIDEAIENSYRVNFEGYNVTVTNSSCKFIVSETLNRLAEYTPFSIGWHISPQGQCRVSLRSKEHGADVSKIASDIYKRGEAISGGGHKNASGILYETVPECLLKPIEN